MENDVRVYGDLVIRYLFIIEDWLEELRWYGVFYDLMVWGILIFWIVEIILVREKWIDNIIRFIDEGRVIV